MNEQIVNLIAALRVIRSHAEIGLSGMERTKDEALRKIITTCDSEISAALQATVAPTTKAEGR